MSPERVRFAPSSELAERVEQVFAAIRNEIGDLLPDATIEHMGATSVPGSITKGDLDVLVAVEVADFGRASRALAARYSIHQPENWTPSFASFSAPPRDGLPVGVQLVAVGSLEERQFLGLRDLLRARPDLVERLNDLKRSFEGRDSGEYWRAKQGLIEALLDEHGLGGAPQPPP